MPTSAAFVAHCADLMAAAGTVRTRRMFGGYGLYVDDLFVAVITGDSLYLKTDSETQPQLAAAGGRQFCFTSRGKVQATKFWTPPPEAIDSPALMLPWAQLAVQAALRERTGARKRR